MLFRSAEPSAPVSVNEVAAWCRSHWPHWEVEFVAAAERAGLTAARDDHGIAALCAREVLRDGWIGPVASRPDLIVARGGLTEAETRLLEEFTPVSYPSSFAQGGPSAPNQ